MFVFSQQRASERIKRAEPRRCCSFHFNQSHFNAASNFRFHLFMQFLLPMKLAKMRKEQAKREAASAKEAEAAQARALANKQREEAEQKAREEAEEKAREKAETAEAGA